MIEGLPRNSAEAAVVAAEIRLAEYLEELEADGQDTTRHLELVRGVEAQLVLLRDRKARLLGPGAQSS